MNYIDHKEVKIMDINSLWLGRGVGELMENAGRGIAEEVARGGEGRKVLVICGTGNNGGDGLVAARYLAREGYEVSVFILGEEMKSRESRRNLELLEAEGVPVKLSRGGEGLEIEGDIVIDALLGTGIEGEVREPYRSAIGKIGSSKAFKVAVDLPSGMDSEGKGYYAPPDLVVTFIGLKRGLEKFNTVLKDIGVPDKARTDCGPGELVVSLKKREKKAHKGDFGRVLVLGGSRDFHGAPLLSSLGSYASGCDLVYLFIPREILTPARCFSPELILKSYPSPYLSPGDIERGGDFFSRADCAVIGPGLGRGEETKEAVLSFLEQWEKPAVIDADGLHALAGRKKVLQGKRAILTPHRGELSALAGREVKDPEKSSKELAADLGCTVLLKGSTDIIASPEGKLKYNDTGNPGMTVGGTGDVLAGVAGGFLAQGAQPFYAACASAFVNGLAGDRLLDKKGYSFLASELAREVPYAMKEALDRVGIFKM